MAEGEGFSFVKSDAANMLKENQQRNIWQPAFKAIQSQAESAAGQYAEAVYDANKDYRSDIAEAYAASKKQEGSIYGRGFSTEGQQQLLEQNRAAMYEAFNAYRNNLQTNVNSATSQYENIMTNLQKQYSATQSALETEAGNITNYGNAFRDYYEYLRGLKDKGIEFATNTAEGDLLEQLENYYGDLPDWNTIVAGRDTSSLSDGNIARTNVSMLNDDGTISNFGKGIYAALQAIEGDYSFGNYLYNNERELHDWLTAYNPYSNTTGADFARNMLGIDSNYSKDKWSTDYMNTVTNEKLDASGVYNAGKVSYINDEGAKVTSDVKVYTQADVSGRLVADKESNINVTVNGVKYKLDVASKNNTTAVDDATAKQLNKFAKVNGNTDKGTLVSFDNKLYVYVRGKGKKKEENYWVELKTRGNTDMTQLYNELNLTADERNEVLEARKNLQSLIDTYRDVPTPIAPRDATWKGWSKEEQAAMQANTAKRNEAYDLANKYRDILTKYGVKYKW